jgi:hypothetical protein
VNRVYTEAIYDFEIRIERRRIVEHPDTDDPHEDEDSRSEHSGAMLTFSRGFLWRHMSP